MLSAFSSTRRLICLRVFTPRRSKHLLRQTDGLTASAAPVKGVDVPFGSECMRASVLERLTLAVAQVFDLDALLLLTGCLLHLAGVVVGAAVGGAHRVEAYVGTVDVANTPEVEEETT